MIIICFVLLGKEIWIWIKISNNSMCDDFCDYNDCINVVRKIIRWTKYGKLIIGE